MTILATRDGLSGHIGNEIDRLERLLADLKRIRDGAAPNADDLTSAPIIDHYVLGARPVPCLGGHVTGHPRLGDQASVTSEVWVFAPDLGWVRTRSRFYLLGRPSGSEATPQ